MLEGVNRNRRGALILAIAAGVIGAWMLSAVTAERAFAQGPGSEFCEEYPDIPGCAPTPEPAPPPEEQADPVEEEETAAPPAAPAAAPTAVVDTGDELPFTGYPLTALILLLLALLLLGFAIRAYLAIRDRVARNQSAGT